MIGNITVKNTIWFSLLVQIITGIVSLHGLFITGNVFLDSIYCLEFLQKERI